MREITIRQNDANQRLDRFISKAVPLLPESLLQKYIRLKRIKVNGKGAKRDTRLAAGDILQLYINDEFFETPSEDNAYLKIATPKLDIVYEDENIILINKKPGMLCHSAGDWSYDTLVANLQAYAYQNHFWSPRDEASFAPALCNRIDRNTGGIVIAAKNAEALRILNQKIKDREISKYYLCVVLGSPRPAKARLENYLFKDASKNQVYISNKSQPGAKTAITQYQTLITRNQLSLVECRLFTGRTHQIRAQMANAGYPLLGDGKYGKERINRRYGEKHQLLYSYKLIFDFPTDAGILNSLRGKAFFVSSVDFVEKYFSGYEI